MGERARRREAFEEGAMTGIDDPRLTAYAVGEGDEETKAAVAASVTLKQEAEEIRDVAQLLSEALDVEPAPSLLPEQRKVIAHGAIRPRRRRRLAAWSAGLAAVLALVATMTIYRQLEIERPHVRSVAVDLPPAPSAMPVPSIKVAPPGSPQRPPSKEEAEKLRSNGYFDLGIEGGVPGGVEGGVAGGVVGGVLGGLPDADIRLPSGPFNREAYAHRTDNDFLAVDKNPLSTFSIDVDTASYSNVRRFLNDGQWPPADAVRIEEMVNYFPYDYAPPQGEEPFAAHIEVAPAPWNKAHRLVRIGLKTRDLDKRPDGNLVFLVDVSGSMQPPNKLPLVKHALRLLVDKLTERDRVAMVVYAGSAGEVLPPTRGDERGAILRAIDRLEAGGSTNGGQGIELAYDLARRHFIRGGVNRVILATDGDFNVGTTDEGSLVRLIEEKAKTGVFLSVFGFGMGNYQDSRLEMLADKGNGNYGYIDTPHEARKALVEQTNATLVTVAKDVKIQVEFNPTRVRSYRLIGYENRLLRPEDFKDDTKDAGEVGAGHSVTALYELVPVGGEPSGRDVDPLAYQTQGGLTEAAKSGELMRLKLRYKDPEGQESRPKEWPVADRETSIEETSPDFRFAAAVAGFGMILRDSPHKGGATLDGVLQLAEAGRGHDRFGYRAELITLVHKAKASAAPTEGTARRR
jgi:Ca-activated chloride channel family protein